MASKWSKMLQDCKRLCSPYGQVPLSKLHRLPLQQQQVWAQIHRLFSDPASSPQPSPRVVAQPQQESQDQPPALLPNAPSLPPATLSDLGRQQAARSCNEEKQQESPSLDMTFIRMMSIQGMSSDEEDPQTLFNSPPTSTLDDNTQPGAASTGAVSAEELLQEAISLSSSLPGGKKSRESLTSKPEMHIASHLDAPNFHPSAPQKRRRKAPAAGDPASPTSTPKKAKVQKAEGDSAEKHPHHDLTSPLVHAVLVSARSKPRTYMLGHTLENPKKILIAEVTEKRSINHRSIMEKVEYACVIYDLW